tara:strand:+ start:432 stop:3353 length:2922 start_codon:yes stop_codon:yes gene_type:complete
MGLKPLNMTMVIAGFIMVTMNLAVLGPMATSAVPGAVEDAVAMKVKDDICIDSLCRDVKDDWKESTSQRDFYVWHILNVDDVNQNGSEPEYEKVGPVTYDVTLKKEVDYYDHRNGLLTYKVSTSYACAKETLVPCSTEVSQLNIAFTPQVVGATGTAINKVMDITKIGFASGVLDIHFKQVSSAYKVAAYNSEYLQNLTATEGSYNGAIVNTAEGNNAESFFLDGMFESLDEAYGDAFLDDNTTTYLEEGGVHPQWNESRWDDDGDGIMEPDENWNSNYDPNDNGIEDKETSSFEWILDHEFMFNHAVGPSGENISLLNYMGPLVYSAMGEPESFDEIIADPDNSVTLERAELWGFEHPTDLNITLARDWTLYGGMGKLMIDYGADDDNYLTNDDDEAVNLTRRVRWLLDMGIDNDVAKKVLTLGNGTDEPLGILAVSESGTAFGLSEFLDMGPQDAIETYGIDMKQYQKLNTFCSDWVNDVSALPLILVGGEGYITASQFVNQSFGSTNPIDSTDEEPAYMELSLNQNGEWGSGTYGFPEGLPVNLTQNESANVLYGEYGIATADGAGVFLYGELSGKSIPINFTSGEKDDSLEWNNQTVALIYGIDENAAGALRLFVMDLIFKDFVPEFLIDSFGTSRYLTQSVNNWILGWHDPVNAYLATDDKDNMTAGWTSLEANETFYGSDAYVEGGISTGEPGTVTICTGEFDTCDKGETVMIGDSEFVSWKSEEQEIASYGLIPAEKNGETIGGFITGDSDLIDLSGYGTVPVICDDTGTLKGIPVNLCHASMDPVKSPIQARLIPNGSLIDATPGALPVYFESNVKLKVEPLSGAIIAGKSQSTFWLDTRITWEQQTPPDKSHLQQVFMIETKAELDDETAEAMESQIVTNQDSLTYFTNFDHWVDYVTLSFWGLGFLSLLAGATMIFMNGDKQPHQEEKWAEDLTSPEPEINLAEEISNSTEIVQDAEETNTPE